MNTFDDALNSSCLLYQKLHNKTVAAVEFAQKDQFESVATSVEEFTHILKEIRIVDGHINKLADKSLISHHKTAWEKRKKIIQRSLDYHQETLPVLESKLALHQSDIKTVRQGIRCVNGYHSGTKQTGQHIKKSL